MLRDDGVRLQIDIRHQHLVGGTGLNGYAGKDRVAAELRGGREEEAHGTSPETKLPLAASQVSEAASGGLRSWGRLSGRRPTGPSGSASPRSASRPATSSAGGKGLSPAPPCRLPPTCPAQP